MSRIPFNRPYMTGEELKNIAEAHSNLKLAGAGPFTARCVQWLQRQTGAESALLTHSCTAALEMAALLSEVGPGDEVIMPSYTFSSTANAFVLRGATPVFVDIRPDTLNLDETKIEQAITPKTRAIVPVHYAGVSCEMDEIVAIARAHDLLVIEDAAQGLMASYRGQALGSIGHLGALSFHETKNIISGEGGALLVNDERFRQRAEIILEKGTNRSAFFRGQIDKYTWVDVGSSYLPGEIVAAFLSAQMDRADDITHQRLALWDAYHQRLESLEAGGALRRPIVPADRTHNAHMYYVLLSSLEARTRVIAKLETLGVNAVFHYVPLHSAPAGVRFGRAVDDMRVTNDTSDRLLRLPLWVGMGDSDIERICDALQQACRT
jgi:dTDP-4-amino-4,6-dideoxygalactose transaminase